MAESAVFLWEGTDRQGRKSKGEISSTNSALARAELRKQGISARKVKKKGKALSLSFGGKITPGDIALVAGGTYRLHFIPFRRGPTREEVFCSRAGARSLCVDRN